MPPKRKTSRAPAAKSPAKKLKPDETSSPESECDLAKTVESLKSTKNVKQIHKVDMYFPKLSLPTVIYEDYDCMLNQTSVGNNNNKFYLIQLTLTGKFYRVWTRWGRVGEPGQSNIIGFFSNAQTAIDIFEKKFKDKTGNDWKNRNNFQAYPDKYSIVELAEDSINHDTSLDIMNPAETLPCTLDPQTQDIISRITDADTFDFAMQSLNIDVKKMPLGKLSSNQLVKAFKVLDEIDKALKSNKKGELETLSSRFYTLVPHNFGRVRPPIIDTESALREKLDLLLVLSDIALAQKLQREPEAKNYKGLPSHPLDTKYRQFQCQMDLVDSKSSEFKLLADYFRNTITSQAELINIWRLNRQTEVDRIAKYNDVKNRKLLFHGTNIACIVAILKTGLRITPRAGGLVGRGLYFASQSQKSWYHAPGDREGHRIMFVAEVVLGNEHYIYKPNWSLVKPPPGFDSVVAVGHHDFDEKQAKSTKLDDRLITIPFAKAVKKSVKSAFDFNEFVIYDESQCKLRYMIEFK